MERHFSRWLVDEMMRRSDGTRLMLGLLAGLVTALVINFAAW